MTEDTTSERPTGLDADLEAALPASVDRAAISRMRTAAYLLDESLRVPGTRYRIGIDPLVGLLPVAGDTVTGILSLYIVVEAARLGVSPGTLAKMVANVAIDVAGGSVPYLGDLFDAAWKANRRNVRLALSDLSAGPGADFEEFGTRVDIE